MKKISVIIPTYKLPKVVDLCIQSAIEGQDGENQIIVIVDGTAQENRDVIAKYNNSPYVQFIVLEQNKGLCNATNLGVLYSAHETILVVNDDNVFPKHWDTLLNADFKEGTILTPNQIEPYGQHIHQFHIKDLGRNTDTFNLKTFQEYEKTVSTQLIEETGSTLPFMMEKFAYNFIGGWDVNYELGVHADMEFFYKLRKLGYKMLRTYNVHFYHFVSLSTKSTQEQAINRHKKELKARVYAKQKWGYSFKSDRLTNVKTFKVD